MECMTEEMEQGALELIAQCLKTKNRIPNDSLDPTDAPYVVYQITGSAPYIAHS